MCLCVFLRVCPGVSMYVQKCAASGSVSVCVRASVRACVRLRTCLRVPIGMYEFVSVRASVHVWLCVCVRVFVFACVRVSLCQCVCVSIRGCFVAFYCRRVSSNYSALQLFCVIAVGRWPTYSRCRHLVSDYRSLSGASTTTNGVRISGHHRVKLPVYCQTRPGFLPFVPLAGRFMARKGLSTSHYPLHPIHSPSARLTSPFAGIKCLPSESVFRCLPKSEGSIHRFSTTLKGLF